MSVPGLAPAGLIVQDGIPRLELNYSLLICHGDSQRQRQKSEQKICA
jgi:hypothetical protein